MRRLSAAAILAAGTFVVATPPAMGSESAVHFLADAGEKATIFNGSKLKLKATCTDTNVVEVRVLTKRKKKQAAMFAATAETNQFGLGEAPRYLGVNRFHKKADGFQLLGQNPGLSAADNSIGTIMVADKESVLAIEWLAESGGILGGDCLFGGVATTAKAESERAFVYRENAPSNPETVTETQDKFQAECADADDTDIFYKTGPSVGSAYVSSFSDFNEDGFDEFGYNQAEAVSSSTVQLDLSGVSDNGSGAIVVPGSGRRYRMLWMASSKGALGKECVFAGIEAFAGLGDDTDISYSAFSAAPPEETLSLQGLELVGGCVSSDLSLQARSAETPAAAHWSVLSDADLAAEDVNEYGEDDTLDASLQSVLSSSNDENALGHIVYARPEGRYVVAHFAADELGLFGSAACAVGGVATTAG